ncbi:hypothetical protein BTH42_31910 [Burkholderia sp. SRS-W-2-2016]|nr:hypothetical protein BTH42_31910 [Burkholderia sp. SRS-W-2-2016]
MLKARLVAANDASAPQYCVDARIRPLKLASLEAGAKQRRFELGLMFRDRLTVNPIFCCQICVRHAHTLQRIAYKSLPQAKVSDPTGK